MRVDPENRTGVTPFPQSSPPIAEKRRNEEGGSSNISKEVKMKKTVASFCWGFLSSGFRRERLWPRASIQRNPSISSFPTPRGGTDIMFRNIEKIISQYKLVPQR